MPEGIALPFKALAYQQLNENRFEKVPENFFYQETMCGRDRLPSLCSFYPVGYFYPPERKEHRASKNQ